MNWNIYSAWPSDSVSLESRDSLGAMVWRSLHWMAWSSGMAILPASFGSFLTILMPKVLVICDSHHLSTALWPFLFTFWIVKVIIWFTLFLLLSLLPSWCYVHDTNSYLVSKMIKLNSSGLQLHSSSATCLCGYNFT